MSLPSCDSGISSVRRLRRLHVTASIEEDARHAVTLLTDALHTASLPTTNLGREVVIRRLALGAISARSSPADLSLQIERVVGEIMSKAVSYDSSGAESANAVIFPGRSEAIIKLARLLARRSSTDEWFWPSLVRGWRKDLANRDRWLLLLTAAYSLPEAVLTASAVLGESIYAGAEEELLSALSLELCAGWLAAGGWNRYDLAESNPREHPLPLFHENIIRRWHAKWGGVDRRLIWLGTQLSIQHNPARASDPRLAAKVAGFLRSVSHEAVAQNSDSSSQAKVQGERDDARLVRLKKQSMMPQKAALAADFDHATEFQGIPSLDSRHSSQADTESLPGEGQQSPLRWANQPKDSEKPVHSIGLEFPGKAAGSELNKFQKAVSQSSSPSSQTDRSIFPEVPETNERSPRSTVEPNGYESISGATDDVFQAEDSTPSGSVIDCAGLFFLVPILKRLGFPEFLAQNPMLLEEHFPRCLLLFISGRVGLKMEDPLALALLKDRKQRLNAIRGKFPIAPGGPHNSGDVLHDGPINLLLLEPARKLLLPRKLATAMDSPLILWLTIVRRWCCRNAGLGLAALIRRPGRAVISSTHIDILFDMTQIDLRLRRLALDVNPGWVPWLGYVIQFHYLEQ